MIFVLHFFFTFFNKNVYHLLTLMSNMKIWICYTMEIASCQIRAGIVPLCTGNWKPP